ncbi:uncharacterized protein LOC123557728 [Mercenaria mercenaria]|uniref:uncharacterized protein LOC123557728 n=1 Tax=Mercenaria mercenaria TaxID=6596 RepID=UPI00234E85C4|nr:uncharacterized protein LOC123557728 [Mercenaria mercenaria]
MMKCPLLVSTILCIGYLTDVNEAWLFTRPSSICQNNQNADPLIQGDNHNAVRNFLRVISDKGGFDLIGDTLLQTGGCRRTISEDKHRKGRFYNDRMWTLDCWEPAECTIAEDGMFFKLIPVSTRTSLSVKARTVLLPLDEHETSSYTFLPMVTRDNILFVTAMLTGCSFFVAKPNNMNCNLVVIHTNYRCQDTSATGTDYNHLQAMAVLEEVQSTNPSCRYHIDRRWAVDYWRSAIEAAGHDYRRKIYYYSIDNGADFLYGSYLSGRWQFCIKIARPNAPSETCFFI